MLQIHVLHKHEIHADDTIEGTVKTIVDLDPELNYQFLDRDGEWKVAKGIRCHVPLVLHDGNIWEFEGTPLETMYVYILVSLGIRMVGVLAGGISTMVMDAAPSYVLAVSVVRPTDRVEFRRMTSGP